MVSFGEDLLCGKHGFSARDGGFRFDVKGGGGLPSHPQANDPLLIEDPVNVMNNVAKNCYKVAAVQQAFVEAYDKVLLLGWAGLGWAGLLLSIDCPCV